LGLHVRNLTADEAKTVGIDSKQGVVVQRPPAPASFGEDLTFRAGDVILSVNGQPVRDVVEYQKIISSLKPGQEVVFRVLEDNQGAIMARRLAGIVPPAN
jgi:S1-C subfamily serine protease